MIDTCGLPMKFEFYVIGSEERKWIVDFNQCDSAGRPKLTHLRSGSSNWPRPAKDYAECIEEGTWIISQVLESVKDPVPVEDLL